MNKDINVMIKAIMLDVDGTLVSFETHKVLPSSVDALRKIHDGGIRIVIATGRAAGDLHEIADVPGGRIVKDSETCNIIVPEGCRMEIEL